MAKISFKVSSKISENLKRFQGVVGSAASRDVNESDTSMIVTDLLSTLFGYDKYSEITTEYSIRGTYCDLAIKIENKPVLLIEVKAIGLELKDAHIKQAVDYAANLGVDWVLLTNGVYWKAFKLIYGQPIQTDEILSFNFLDLNPRSAGTIEMLFLLCREGLVASALSEFCAQKQAVNRFSVAAVLQTEPILKLVRRELGRVYPDVKPRIEDIENILVNEVLKREVFDGDQAKDAVKKVRRMRGKIAKQKEVIPDQERAEEPVAANAPAPVVDSGDIVH